MQQELLPSIQLTSGVRFYDYMSLNTTIEPCFQVGLLDGSGVITTVDPQFLQKQGELDLIHNTISARMLQSSSRRCGPCSSVKLL